VAPKIITSTKSLESLTFLTVQQTSDLLQVSTEHVYRKIRANELPGAEFVLGVWRVRTDVLLGRVGS